MAENLETISETKNSSTVSPLAQNAGAFLTIAVFATVGGLLAYGSTMKVSSPWVIGCLIVGFVSLAFWFVGRSQQKALPRDQYAKQRTLLGTNALISAVLFFALLVGINYVAARRHKTFDLTSNKVNTLADQTLKALGNLKAPVQMTYVYAPTSVTPENLDADKALLNKYKLASDNVRVKYVNALFEPATFRALNMVGFMGRPTVLIEPVDKGKEKNASRQQVDTIDESNLTSALMKLGKNESRTLYYLTGHGEIGFDSTDPNTSYSTARSKLTGQNYTIKSLSLAKSGAKIPDDASVVVALGPKADLSSGEEAILNKYVNGKGHFLLAWTATDNPMPRWKSIARLLGANILSGFVIDPEQFIEPSPQFVYGQVIDPSKHPILGGVGENSRVIFPGAVPLKQVSPAPNGLTITTLLESSPSSQTVPFKNGGETQKGPFALAIVSQRGSASPTTPNAPPAAPDMRALVVCNANFGSDGALVATANESFLLASINWLAGNDLLVSVPPKPPVTNTIDMTPGVRRFANVFSLFTLPIMVLFIGGIVWWKRR
jgi:hypothetical protein